MNNNESFDNIAAAIAKTDDAIFLYDSLTERCEIAQKTVEALTGDVASLHRNDAGLDTKTRANKFGATNNALSLAEGDLRSAQASLATQKLSTVAIGKVTARIFLEIRDALRAKRVANISARLSAEFDWSQIHGVRVQDIAAAHRSVLAIKDLEASALHYRLQHDDDFTIQSLRNLNAIWTELRPLIESEPGIELSIAPVTIPPTPKPKPAANGSNTLGTLTTQAVAA